MRFWAGLLLTMLLVGCGAERPDPVSFAARSPDPVKHGERVALVLGCSGCHRADLAGQKWSEPEFGTVWTANLTVAAAEFDDA